jgi:hypothetical protein
MNERLWHGLQCIAGNDPHRAQVRRGAQIASARPVASQTRVEPDEHRRDALRTVAGAQFLARPDA